MLVRTVPTAHQMSQDLLDASVRLYDQGGDVKLILNPARGSFSHSVYAVPARLFFPDKETEGVTYGQSNRLV